MLDDLLDNPTRFRCWFESHVPGFIWTGAPPEPLAGGLMNGVWRVRATPHDLVLKHAPPHVASAPDIALSPARLALEARALKYVQGRLEVVDPWRVEVPVVRGVDVERAAMWIDFMENAEPLDTWAHSGDESGVYESWGESIGRLHGSTHEDSQRELLQEQFDNRAVQRTRQQVQYRAARGWLEALEGDVSCGALSGLADVLEELGRDFVEDDGACLVMGDAWPRSVLIDESSGKLCIIDWEFAHHGQPAQDVGHVMAHLWLMGHRRRQVPMFQVYAQRWMHGYTRGLEAHGASALWSERARQQALAHEVAELLARTCGPFVTGQMYMERGEVFGQAIDHIVSIWRTYMDRYSL